ncbi:MAG: hypothetical protein AAFO04_23635 [Cyanobacteria bacterium J06592_8]
MKKNQIFWSAIAITATTTCGISLNAEAANLSTGLNFTGSTYRVDSFFIPPDTMGSVGSDHIVELINGRYSVYDKVTGNRVQTSSLRQFWNDSGVNRFDIFDPRIVYDPFSERWFAISAADRRSDISSFLLAVSNTSNPTQGWTGFAIDGDSTDQRWVDYPTLGLNQDGVYLAANMFPISSGGLRTTIVALPKDDLLTSQPTVANATVFENNFTSETGLTVQPVVDLDNTGMPAALLSDFNTFSGTFKRSNLVGDIISPSLDTSDGLISVTPYSSIFSAEQPGPKQNLEIFSGSIFHGNIVQQNGTFWGVQTVNNNGRAALRWFQIDASNNQLLQEGLITDPELDFYYGSIAVNELGDVVIGFSGSGESQFVSTYAVGGQTYAGVTIFGEPSLLKEGVADYQVTFNGRNRWGDYSATVVDPTDSSTFWTFQEFVSAEDTWSTQITELQLFSDINPELLNNGGFETGNFSDWRRIGNTTIETAALGTSPTEGIFQALLSTGGATVPDSSVEAFLGLDLGSLDTLSGQDLTSGSAIQQAFTANAGDLLTFDWNFLTDENTPTFFNDLAFVSISSLSTLADTTFPTFVSSLTPFNEETGFQPFSFTVPSNGTYTLGIGVVDAVDTVVDSGLLIDNVALKRVTVPEPTSIFSLISLGVFSISAMLKRK